MTHGSHLGLGSLSLVQCGTPKYWLFKSPLPSVPSSPFRSPLQLPGKDKDSPLPRVGLFLLPVSFWILRTYQDDLQE